MEIVGCDDAAGVAEAAANAIADRLRTAVAERGQAVLALSGGSTPAMTFAKLAASDLDWDKIHVVQVDERAAPWGHDDRNWTMLHRNLVWPAHVPQSNAHPIMVEDEDAAEAYDAKLGEVAGPERVIDVLHLGLGDDGHTASLVPGDPVLDVTDRDVARTRPYRGHERVTLTYPAIDRARTIVWQVEGMAKGPAVKAVLAQDPSAPAARVRQDGDVLLIADRAALGER